MELPSAIFQCIEIIYVLVLQRSLIILLGLTKNDDFLELESKELNHFGVIAGLFRQIGSNSSRFVLHILLLLKTFHCKND